MKRRLTMAIGLSAMTGLIGFGTTAAHANGPGRLARLAAEQSQAWENDIATTPGLSPTTCVRSRAEDDIVMLPVLTGFVDSPLAVSCTVKRGDHLLLDVGGSILWEDANVCGTVPEPCYTVNGTPTPFRPATLPAIAAQIIQDFSPFGQATLDGRTVKYRTLRTTFTMKLPTDAFNYADSEAVGHPGTLAADRDRWEIQLAHPLFGDAIQAAMSATRRRERALVIAERIEQWGMRRSDDALRVALARHTAGAAVSAPLAVEAAQTAHGRGAHALAEQFARMAFHDAPTVTSGVLLAYALMYQGRAADADTLLNSLEPIIGGAEDRALVATTQSLNAMHGLVDIERAEEILAHHTPLVEGPWRWEISGPTIGVDLYAGRIGAAVAAVDAALADPELPPRAQLAVLTAGLIPMYLGGRATDAVTLGRQLRQDFLRFSGGVPTLRVQAELELAEALAWAGDLQGARALCSSLRARAEEEGDGAGLVIITIVTGLVATHAGAHREAADALVALGSLEQSAYRPWPPYLYGRLAAVAHRIGDERAGDDYLERCATWERPGLRLHELCTARARAEAHAARGGRRGAVAALHAVTARAVALGNRAEALYAAVRAAALSADTHDLRAALAVASTFQGVLGETVAAGLDACLHDDSRALAGAANRLHGRGFVLLADDLDLLAQARPTADTAEPRTPVSPARLTDREQEIAHLVEQGRSDAEIAQQLGISVRTVHAHVRSIFAKLGVSRRRDVRGDAGPD